MSIGKETDEYFIFVPAPRLIRWVVRAGPGRFEGAVAFSNVCMRVSANAKAIDVGGAVSANASL